MKQFELSSFVGGIVVGMALTIGMGAVIVSYLEHRTKQTETNLKIQLERGGFNLQRNHK